MSEIITSKKIIDHSFYGSAVLEMLSAAMSHGEFADFVQKARDNGDNYEIKITINGLEVSFQSLMNKLQNSYQDLVEAGVAKRFEQLFDDNERVILDMLEDVKRTFHDNLRKKNIRLSGDDW